MKIFKLLYLRDKNFFEKRGNSYVYLGNPISIAKKLDYDGIYIYDLNLEKGKLVNLDIYDSLSYITHIQVDAKRDLTQKEAELLYSINCRITFYSPPSYEINPSFSAFFATSFETPEVFKDIVVKKESIAKHFLETKRVFFIGKTSLPVFCLVR